MELAEKNGQQSMEEILASIRRIIAEEPAGSAKIIDLTARDAPQTADFAAEDGSDFELPSMFRPVQPQPERVTPLFGRLTDAIRGASASQASAETRSDRAAPRFAANAEPGYAQAIASDMRHEQTELRMPNPQPNAHLNGPANGHPANGQLNGLSTLHLVRRDFAAGEPEASAYSAPHDDPVPIAGTAAVAESNSQLPRQMAAFKDTRFCKMTAPVTASPVSQPMETEGPFAAAQPLEVQSEQSLAAAFAEVLNAAEQTARHDGLHGPADAASVYPAFGDTPSTFGVPASRTNEAGSGYALTPPPLEPAAATGGIEDQTADLLRPMLRQWLADNMPKMVEKALHIEVTESVRQTKKFNGT